MKTRILPIGYSPLANPYNGKGFSLLELLIVIAIIGLFSTLLVIRLEGFFSEGALRQAAKMIINDIGTLRAKAAYTHLEQQMVFNIDEESYHIIDQDNAPVNDSDEEADDTEPLEKQLPGDIDLEDVMFLTGEKIQEGEARLRFFANGSVQSALIHLKNNNAETYTLEINPLTGHVIIHETYIEQKIID